MFIRKTNFCQDTIFHFNLTRAVLVFVTERKNHVNPCLRSQFIYVKVYNKKVICHLSMKLSDKFDPNQMCTSDKIVVKQISAKETLLKLDLEPKGQGYSEQQNNKQGNKKIFHLLINRARLCLVTVVRLSRTGYK